MNILQTLFSQSRQLEGDVTKFFQVCIPEYEHPTYNSINKISLDVESEDTQIQETNSVPFHATLASSTKRNRQIDPEHLEKKRGRIKCHVEGCEGFNVGHYYPHMTEHYQENVARDLNLEMESQNQSNRVPLACPRNV